MSKASKIYVLNGPNLNLLGDREPDIYGNVSLKDIEKSLISYGKENNSEIYFKQSNQKKQMQLLLIQRDTRIHLLLY